MEAYKIAIGISLKNHVSSILGMIARDFAKTDAAAVKLKKTLSEIKLLSAAGLALGGAGATGIFMIDRMVKHAKEYQHQLALMNTAGMTQLEIVKATQAAWATTRSVPTSSVTENMAAIRELRMVFGNTSDAVANMPTVQRLQAILSTVKGVNAHDEAYTVAKALEMRGAVRNPAEFTTQADAMAKAIVASGGKVGAADFLSAFKYGRTATSGWNDIFTYQILPTLIQEMKTRGGSGSGTGGPGNALMSAFSAIVGGTVSQKALKLWEKLGLLDPSKEVFTTTHHLKGIRPGGMMGAAMFQANPFEWTQKYLLPALAAHGYTTAQQRREALQYLFPNRTAGFVMTQMALQPWKFQRGQRLIQGAEGLSAYRDLLKNDPMMAALALQKQWDSLLAILGFQIMPGLIKATLFLSDTFGSLGRWMYRHQEIAKALVWTFTGLSVAMLFGGAVLGLTAAFKGLSLILGVGSLAPAALSLLGTNLGAAALGFARIAGPLAIIVGILSLLGSSKNFDQSQQSWMAQHGLTGNSGIGARLGAWWHSLWGGGPGSLSSFGPGAVAAPIPSRAAASGGVTISKDATINFHFGDRTIASITGDALARYLGGPATGPVGFDPTQHVTQP